MPSARRWRSGMVMCYAFLSKRVRHSDIQASKTAGCLIDPRLRTKDAGPSEYVCSCSITLHLGLYEHPSCRNSSLFIMYYGCSFGIILYTIFVLLQVRNRITKICDLVAVQFASRCILRALSSNASWIARNIVDRGAAEIVAAVHIRLFEMYYICLRPRRGYLLRIQCDEAWSFV